MWPARVYVVNTYLGSPCARKRSCKGSQFFFHSLYHTHLSVNKVRGLQLNGRFQMFPTSVPKNPMIFSWSLRLKSRMCRLHTKLKKKKKRKKKKTPYGAKCWQLSSFFPDKILRSCENISCKVPKTTEIMVVMVLPCWLPAVALLLWLYPHLTSKSKL